MAPRLSVRGAALHLHSVGRGADATPPIAAQKLSTSTMIIATILALGAESKDASSTKTCFGDAVTNAVRALMPQQRTQLCKCLS